MSFAVPESGPSVGAFEFTVPGRKGVFHMTRIGELDLGTIADLADDSRMMIGVLAAAVDDESREALKSLKGPQVAALMSAWKADSAVTPGESSAS